MEKNMVLGGLFGVCIGDALGGPVELKSRSELAKDPVQDMKSYSQNYPPGTWSDDSALTFCLAESLCSGYSVADIADKFLKWYKDGYWSSWGEAFGIGNTTLQALKNLEAGIAPLEAGGRGEYDNGNGSLMRILPLAYYLKDKEPKKRFKIIHQVSSITHAHPRAKLACGIYNEFAISLLEGDTLRGAYERMKKNIKSYCQSNEYKPELDYYSRILEEDIAKLLEEEINSSGYVVDTLEASLWCLFDSNSYVDAVLRAVNLGGDADTTGAVTGGLAGIYYGFKEIPDEWVEQLVKKEEIFDLAERFYNNVCR